MSEESENERREEAIAELQAALAELEGYEGLSRFVVGHGLMSRLFEYEWRSETLEIEFRLPYARVLADEESQAEDAAEIGAALRMAILLLTLEGMKGERLDGFGMSVWAAEGRNGYAIHDADGNTVDSGDDWSGLVSRLEATLPENSDELSIIWP